MATKVQPIILRDMSRGRVNNDAVDESLIPQNSVEHAMNFSFDQKIGSAVVRSGTTSIGTPVAAALPLGIAEFYKPTLANDYLVYAANGATNTTSLWYYNGTTWTTSNLTTLHTAGANGQYKVRFATLLGRIFEVNGSEVPYSSADGATWDSTTYLSGTSHPLTGVYPSLIFSSKAHLLLAGDPTYPDRVYLSSLADSVNGIDWWVSSAPPTTGTAGWIDINPDDNSRITGFAETSNTTLIFKNQGLYRLDVINQTVDTQSICNFGAVSQEAIVNCQGIVYFFSGYNICQTSGDIPQEISRLGVQDFINAIPQTNWVGNGTSANPGVCAGTDGLNVHFSIGNITLNLNKNDQKTYNNVVLKFSPRDQAWSTHYYAQQPSFFTQYTITGDKRYMISADTSSLVQVFNKGTTDNTKPINYELIFQEQECQDRSHLNKISDKIVVFGDGLNDCQLQVKSDDAGKDYQDLEGDLSKRVNIINNINLEGYFFSFRIFGESSGTAPTFEGLQIENITDMGITKS